MHLILNITHLERYNLSPSEFGDRPNKTLQCKDFMTHIEYEVKKILKETTRKGRNGCRVPYFLMRFKGYGKESYEWLSKHQLHNTPEVMAAWCRLKIEQWKESQ